MEILKNVQTILTVLLEHKIAILTLFISIFGVLFTIYILNYSTNKTEETIDKKETPVVPTTDAQKISKIVSENTISYANHNFQLTKNDMQK